MSICTCPYYLNGISDLAPHCKIRTGNNFCKLKNPFRNTNMGQEAIFYIGPSIWKSLLESVKKIDSLNTFKHNVKKQYLIWITHNVYIWKCVSVFAYVCMPVSVRIYTYGYKLVCFPLTYPFSCFFSFIFSLIFVLTWKTTMKTRCFARFVLSKLTHCKFYSYLSAVIPRLELLYFNLLTSLFVCLFVFLFYLG